VADVSLGWDMKFAEMLAAAGTCGWPCSAPSWSLAGLPTLGPLGYVDRQAVRGPVPVCRRTIVIFLPMIGWPKFMTMDVGGQQIASSRPRPSRRLIMFGGLTAYALLSRRDFSFMGGFLAIIGFAAIALIVVSIVVGFDLGVWFSAAMIIFASAYILYYTSNILHQYRTDQYVSAALALFALVALLFWYVLRIFMALSNRN
jgi:hypothetical protein